MCWLSDVGSPIALVLVSPTLAFEPPGIAPEIGMSLEAVRLACTRYGGTWEEGLSARENIPAIVAGCTVVADKVAFASAVGRPLVLNDRSTALDLEYYYH